MYQTLLEYAMRAHCGEKSPLWGSMKSGQTPSDTCSPRKHVKKIAGVMNIEQMLILSDKLDSCGGVLFFC